MRYTLILSIIYIFLKCRPQLTDELSFTVWKTLALDLWFSNLCVFRNHLGHLLQVQISLAHSRNWFCGSMVGPQKVVHIAYMKCLIQCQMHEYSINNSFLLGKQILFIFKDITTSLRFGMPLVRWNPMLSALFPRVEEVGK